MKIKILVVAVVILIFLFSSQAYAQVLFTGKTSGINHGSIYIFGTVSTVDEVASSNNWIGLVLGITDKVDVVLGWGDMTSLGEHFPYGALGGVVALPTKKFGFDSMFYQLFSVPNANREKSSTFFGNSVLIISKDFVVNNHALALYTGYTGNYSFGPKDRLLTFPDMVHQVPVGIFASISDKWGLTVEYDQGSMKSFGMALNYSFEYR